MTARLPNFFILGAPKCGTTSLAAWLGEHENIYMSPEKEPNYFNADVKMTGRMSDREYQALFRGVGSEHVAVGEATTGYLRSTTAVERILHRVDDARFIVCVRNPIEMAVSFHGEMVKSGIETETDFTTAWNLQDSRRCGRHVPRLCLHKEDLLYGSVCKLGEQIESLIGQVGKERVLIIVLDDMKVDPGREYRRTLNFLAVSDDGRDHFPGENKALHLSPYLAGPLRAAALIKRSLRIRKKTGAITLIRRLAGQAGVKQELTPDMRKELADYFRSDVEKLGSILDRDLSGWLHIGAEVASDSVTNAAAI